MKQPPIDPDGAGQQAVELYDADGSGALTTEELKKCPAILAVMDKYDTDGDDQISDYEISAQLRAWAETGIALTGATFYVKLNGRPLQGALVELTPEPFLGEGIKTASGTSSKSGTVSPSLREEDLPDGVRGAMQYGLYKVRVTHDQIAIPANYNEQTELGLEVPPHFDIYNPPVFELKANR